MFSFLFKYACRLVLLQGVLILLGIIPSAMIYSERNWQSSLQDVFFKWSVRRPAHAFISAAFSPSVWRCTLHLCML
jgi:hypothetical protein